MVPWFPHSPNLQAVFISIRWQPSHYIIMVIFSIDAKWLCCNKKPHGEFSGQFLLLSCSQLEKKISKCLASQIHKAKCWSSNCELNSHMTDLTKLFANSWLKQDEWVYECWPNVKWFLSHLLAEMINMPFWRTQPAFLTAMLCNCRLHVIKHDSEGQESNISWKPVQKLI